MVPNKHIQLVQQHARVIHVQYTLGELSDRAGLTLRAAARPVFKARILGNIHTLQAELQKLANLLDEIYWGWSEAFEEYCTGLGLTERDRNHFDMNIEACRKAVDGGENFIAAIWQSWGVKEMDGRPKRWRVAGPFSVGTA